MDFLKTFPYMCVFKCGARTHTTHECFLKIVFPLSHLMPPSPEISQNTIQSSSVFVSKSRVIDDSQRVYMSFCGRVMSHIALLEPSHLDLP